MGVGFCPFFGHFYEYSANSSYWYRTSHPHLKFEVPIALVHTQKEFLFRIVGNLLLIVVISHFHALTSTVNHGYGD